MLNLSSSFKKSIMLNINKYKTIHMIENANHFKLEVTDLELCFSAYSSLYFLML